MRLPLKSLYLPAALMSSNRQNSVIGSLSSVDPDQGDVFTYSLTTGGYPDNAFFDIAGTLLVSRQPLDFETKNQYVVEVRSTDAGLLTSLKTFTITVNNVNQPPTTTPTRYDLRLRRGSEQLDSRF